MAFVLCEQHGGHVAPLVCEHLRDAVRERHAIATVFRIDAWYLGERAWTNFVCSECARHNSITANPTIWRDDDALDRLFAIDCEITPVCRLCFEEAQLTA